MKISELIKYYPKDIEIEIITNNERTIYKGKPIKISRMLLYRRVKEIEPYINEQNKVVIRIYINEVIL